ncbi:MAG: dephospho-CoA kinase [Bacteroidetes bacterium]|nr:dephospho-CoA kinase [Bacteroidota bacterium]
MLKVGLTGGIGSGKSTVARIFTLLGIPVYQADAAAKRLMNTHPVIIQEIKSIFSTQAYTNDQLDTTYLSEQAFQHPEKLSRLNALVHPYTINDAKTWMQQQSSPYAIKEAALIFESGSQGEFDCIIGVSAPQPLRVKRAMKRDNKQREDVLSRMEHQLDESIKMKLCDFIVINDEQHLIIPQVLDLHQQLLSLSTAH